jgi:hypothetical protein
MLEIVEGGVKVGFEETDGALEELDSVPLLVEECVVAEELLVGRG